MSGSINEELLFTDSEVSSERNIVAILAVNKKKIRIPAKATLRLSM
jgi:hypothetical protein